MPEEPKPSLGVLIAQAARSEFPALREYAAEALAAFLSGDTRRAGQLYARGMIKLKQLEQQHELDKRSNQKGDR